MLEYIVDINIVIDEEVILDYNCNMLYEKVIVDIIVVREKNFEFLWYLNRIDLKYL